MEFRQQTLDNGLQVVAECNGHAVSTGAAFFVRTGSRDESDEVSGVSHFLEHMAFKGTPRRTAADVNRELDELGSHANAFTSEEQTVYYAAFLPEYQDRIVEVLADIMRPSLRPDDFATEQQVILEEIHKYDDQPPFGAHEKCMAAHFGAHPLGRSILGTLDSVGALTPERMRAYFQRRYSPGNMVLVAAGRVDFDSLVATAEEHCGSWEPMDAPREATRAGPHSGFQVMHKEMATQEYVVQLANGPAAEDEDRYAARVCAAVLGDDSGSRLFWELIDTGKADYAAMAAHEFQGTGLTMTYLACSPEQTAENLRCISEIQRAAESAGITEAELRQAKNKICSHIVLQSERPVNRLFSVGNNWVQRQEYQTVKEILAAFEAVSRDDVADVLAKYPLSDNTTVVIGPLEELQPPAG